MCASTHPIHVPSWGKKHKGLYDSPWRFMRGETEILPSTSSGNTLHRLHRIPLKPPSAAPASDHTPDETDPPEVIM